MKGSSGRATQCELECGNAVERRKLVVREDQVNFIVFKCGQKLVAGLNAGDFTDEIFCFEEPLNELCVPGVVLQQ